MKNFKKLFAFFILIGVLVVLASCGNASGVKAVLQATTVSSSKVVLKASFDENENLKSKAATASIKKYTYNDSGAEESSGESKSLSFSNDVYTSATTEFTKLTKNTKYLFKLFIKFNSYEEEVAKIEVTTTNAGDDEAAAIEITDVDGLNSISADVSAYYKLMNDIDLTDKTLNMGLSATSSERFKGHFDGNGHTIKNLNLTSASNIGLFAYTESAVIKNLTIDGVTGDFSTGRTTANIGALIGAGEKTLVENVTVKNVNITIQGNTSAELNVGGIVGKADKSSFSNVKAENVSITFSRARLKVSAGLFSGLLTGQAINKTTIEDVEQQYLANACSATGKIEALLYYPSSEGFTHIGGFSGDISSQSLVYDTYTDATIKVTKDTTSSYSNKYDLAVGGFLGCNNNGSGLKIEKSLAYVSIEAYAGVKPTSTNGDYTQMREIADGESFDAYKEALNAAIDEEYAKFVAADYTSTDYANITTIKDTAKASITNATTASSTDGALFYYNDCMTKMNEVNKIVDTSTFTSSSSTAMYYSYIGGFAGSLHKYISTISNCLYYAKSDMVVMAKDKQSITKDGVTNDEQVLFVDEIVAKNYDNDSKIVNTIKYVNSLDLSQYGNNVKAFIESLNK